MENFMNMNLRLTNSECDSQFMHILPDRNSVDLIAFSFVFNNTEINLESNKEETDGNGEEFFHIDKFQTKCLIDYLQNLYSVME